MSPSEGDSKLEVMCPCCQATMIIDRATGIVISHEAAKEAKANSSIADILQDMKSKKESSERLFDREMSSMKDRERLLEEKLQQAVKKAKEMKDEKPIRPIDLE